MNADRSVTRRAVLVGTLAGLSGCQFLGSDGGTPTGTPTATAPPESVRVERDGDAAYRSIQAAVDAVAPGGRVEIGPGRYRESVVVSTKGVTIVADGDVTLSPGQTVSTAGIAIAREATGVTVEGLSVSGFTGSGGSIAIRGDRTTLRNTVVKDAFLGIVSTNSTVTLSGTAVANTSAGGILLRGGTRATLSEVTATDNGGPGIDVDRTTRVRFEAIRTSNNRTRGIDLDGIEEATLDGVTTADNGLYGLQIRRTGEATVGRVVAENNRHGIDLEGVASAEIVRTTVRGNAVYGLEADGGTVVALRRSSAVDNGDHGIDVDRVPTVTLSGIRSVGNGASGVRIARFREATVGASILTDNAVSGLLLADSRVGTRETVGVRNAVLAGNEHGLEAEPRIDAGRVTLQECRIEGNAAYGVLNGNRSAAIVATENWWGAADGPTGRAADGGRTVSDPETGAAADGAGDRISRGSSAGVANVRFDPFLAAAPDRPTAGAEDES